MRTPDPSGYHSRSRHKITFVVDIQPRVTGAVRQELSGSDAGDDFDNKVEKSIFRLANRRGKRTIIEAFSEGVARKVNRI